MTDQVAVFVVGEGFVAPRRVGNACEIMLIIIDIGGNVWFFWHRTGERYCSGYVYRITVVFLFLGNSSVLVVGVFCYITPGIGVGGQPFCGTIAEVVDTAVGGNQCMDPVVLPGNGQGLIGLIGDCRQSSGAVIVQGHRSSQGIGDSCQEEVVIVGILDCLSGIVFRLPYYSLGVIAEDDLLPGGALHPNQAVLDIVNVLNDIVV